MSYDGKITTYLQTGSGAPSGAPNVPSGVLVLYEDETGDQVYAYNWTASAWQTVGGGGGVTTPAIRGTGIQASSASSFTVDWPSGTVAGDLAIICQGGGYPISSTPSGWTLLNTITGFQSGSCIAKVLNSTDITAGGVTLTMGGTYDATVAIITFVGSTGGIIGVTATETGSGSTSQTVIPSAYIPAAGGVYFGSNRGSGTATCSQGSLEGQANSGGGNNYGCLYAGAPSGVVLNEATFSYSAIGGGTYQVIIFVAG